jgi:hypothetical protein
VSDLSIENIPSENILKSFKPESEKKKTKLFKREKKKEQRQELGI